LSDELFPLLLLHDQVLVPNEMIQFFKLTLNAVQFLSESRLTEDLPTFFNGLGHLSCDIAHLLNNIRILLLLVNDVYDPF